MPENNPAQEPDDLPVLFPLPSLSIASNGVVSGGLAVVTEDGRRMRVIGARYLGCCDAEITVAEEGA
jgi:hypothetical protein